MKYYPVIIPTLNRYTHFKNCVESLSRCTHADKTELVIGLDYPPSDDYMEGYMLIKKYISSIKGFSKVTLFEHGKNLGAIENSTFLVNYCNLHYDAYIYSEDDNVFAPAFLDYMNKALELYYNDESIITVSGYNFEEAYDQGDYTCYLSRENCAWGTGYWFHKERTISKLMNSNFFFKQVLKSHFKAKKIVDTYPALYLMLNSMIRQGEDWGDIKRATINIQMDKYQLKPAISLVRNCGYDGSGIHCGYVDNGLNRQFLSKEKFFNFGNGINRQESIKNKRLLYDYFLPKESERRENQLKLVNLLYKQNTDVFFKIRTKLALRTRLKRILGMPFFVQIIKRWIRNIVEKSIPEIRYLDYLRDKGNEYHLLSSIIRSDISPKAKLYPVYQITDSKIGDYTYISRNCVVSKAYIGKFCSIGPNFFCGWGIHPIDGISTSPMFYSTMKQNGITFSDKDKVIERKSITIGNDVYIGANVTILDGITIGDGAVIGAGAVVSKDIPAYAIAVGCPIQIKRYRFDEKTKAKLLRIKWWEDPDKYTRVEQYFFDINKFLSAYDEKEDC